MDLKRISTAFARMPRLPDPKFFERGPNQTLVNTSRPMPQTTYEKNNICMDDFSSKLQSSILMSDIYSFLPFS